MNWGLIAIGIIGFCAGSITGAGIGWHYGVFEGRHEGKCEEKERWLEHNRRRNAHRLPPAPQIRAKAGPLPPAPRPLPRAAGPGVPLQAGTGKPTAWPATAAGIAPVLVPVPGSHRPQPATSPADDTITSPAITDTGELRALTNEYIHDLRWREEQHRRQTTGA